MTLIYSRKGLTPDYTSAAEPLSEISLYGMAQTLLERTRQASFERGITLPERQIIYMSPIPADCDQVAVLMSGWVPTPTWEGTTQCQNFRWVGQFSITITRSTPAMPSNRGKAAPTSDAMNRAAKIASDDAEVLLTVVRGLSEIGQDFALETAPPEGGLQSTVMVLQLPAFGALE